MEKLLTMQEACNYLGVTKKTIQRWDGEGRIKIIRTPGGHRRIPVSEVERLTGSTVSTERKMAIYARVSSNEQKKSGDLERQAAFLEEGFSSSFSIVEVVQEVGSGLNDKRKGLLKIMRMAKDEEITDVGIRYKDRLTRFGFGYLEEYCTSYGVAIHVLDKEVTNKTVQEEMADDLISIITSFSGKLYGMRSIKHKELKEVAKEAILDVSDVQNEDKESEDCPSDERK